MKAGLLWICMALAAVATPEKIELADGRILEGVSSVEMENDKVRIVHASGVSRIEPKKISSASLKEILSGELGSFANPLADLKRVETLDGKIYEGVRNVKIKPSFISFLHDGGAASVRLENVNAELRALCGYDEETAKEFDRARKQAETSLAKAELEHEQKMERKALAEEQRQRRQRAIWEFEALSYGDERYWSSGQRGRMLYDAMMMNHLQRSGFSPAEATHMMDNKRFR
jgi:hypothetical protein